MQWRWQQWLVKAASRPLSASSAVIRTSDSTAGYNYSVPIGYSSSPTLLLAALRILSRRPQQLGRTHSSMYERGEAITAASASAAIAPQPAVAAYINSRDNVACYGTRNKVGHARRSRVVVVDTRRSLGTGSIAISGQRHRSLLARAGGGNDVVSGGGGGVVGARCGQRGPTLQQAMATLSEGKFHDVADDTLEDINDAVERSLEDEFDGEFDCNVSQGVLNIVVNGQGTWVLNKQSPNRQIWWSSPVSGPMRFEYDHEGRRWLNARDGVTELRSLLTLELKATCGVNVDLE